MEAEQRAWLARDLISACYAGEWPKEGVARHSMHAGLVTDSAAIQNSALPRAPTKNVDGAKKRPQRAWGGGGGKAKAGGTTAERAPPADEAKGHWDTKGMHTHGKHLIRASGATDEARRARGRKPEAHTVS